MFKSALKSGGRRVALLTALASLMLAVGASSALASVSLSPTGPYANPEAVAVSGTAPSGTTHVAVAACNTSEGEAFWGTRCDVFSATEELEPVAKFQSPSGIGITVQRAFEDFTFISGSPVPVEESETVCYSESLEAGEACGVVVSYYDLSKGFKRLGDEMAPITFE